MFISSLISTTLRVLYALLLILGAVSDVRARRIPNLLNLALVGVGFVYAMLASGNGSHMVGWAVAGVGTGFLVWLPFYLLGMLGAGDVKFFAGASAWLGPQVALSAAALAAISGGVLALLWMVWSAIASRSAQASAASVNVVT